MNAKFVAFALPPSSIFHSRPHRTLLRRLPLRPRFVAVLPTPVTFITSATFPTTGTIVAALTPSMQSMLDFSLSGPGYTAAGLFLVSVAVLLTTYFNFGPTPILASPGSFFCLRVMVSKKLVVELPSGGVAELRPGDEAVLRAETRPGVDALLRRCLRAAERGGVECRCTVYRADGSGLVMERVYPRNYDAAGAEGWVKDRDGGRVDSESADARWDEYERLGSFGGVEDEWRKVMEGLGGVRREEVDEGAKNSCKLCAGTGRRKCMRCMGASASGRTVCPSCVTGRVACEMCEGSGRFS
mmetsp:Transcript_12490/g.33117  ORF Transcript_12490/g.33117 Transcript_12490/m.33117 type:complete len:299 (+) Transcript_12490:113-1009(+)